MAKHRTPAQRLTKAKVAALKPADKPYEIPDSAVAGLVIRVEPGGTMTWFVKYNSPVTKVRTRYKLGRESNMPLEQARSEARRIHGLIEDGKDPMEQKRAERAQEVDSLGDFIDKVYKVRWLARRKSGDATYKRLKFCFGDWWKRPLNAITPKLVEQWRAERLAKGTAMTTMNRDVTCLKAVLNKAVEWDFIPANPIQRIKPEKTDEGGSTRYLSAMEERALFEALDEYEEEKRAERDSANRWRRERGYEEFPDLRQCAFVDYMRPMIQLSLDTGLRRGEVFSLTWCDVRLHGNPPTVTVRGETAKSSQTRHIPLHESTRAMLESWKQQTAPDSDAALVFRSPKGGLRLNNVKRRWKSILKRAKIEGFRWHDMRHHFGSKLAMAGVPLYTIAKLMGHSSVTITERYAHLSPNHSYEAIQRMKEGPQNIHPFPGNREKAEGN